MVVDIVTGLYSYKRRIEEENYSAHLSVDVVLILSALENVFDS